MLNFYMIPSVVRFDHFLYVMSRIGVVLIIIGSLPLLGLPTQFGFIDVSLWGYFSAFRIPIITSVFVNPNQLGFFLFVGTIGAFREQYFSESSVSTVLLSINTIGLISSHYRAGWMALLAALGLWYTYIFCGRQGVVTATISGIATIAIGLGLLFGVIPGPQTLTDLSLNGRRELWTASIHVLQNNVLTGKGFLGTADIIGNPHNSYLRMFTSFGLIGGFSYTLLVVGVTVGSAREAVTAEKLFLAMLLVGFVLVQLFNQLSFVGLSMRSSIIAMFMGYYIVDE
jgi:O-antigen ligase